MALWYYNKYTVIEEPYYSDWEPFSGGTQYGLVNGEDYVSGYTDEPVWSFDSYRDNVNFTEGKAIMFVGTSLYSRPSNGDLECSYTKTSYGPPSSGDFRLVPTTTDLYGMRREILYYNYSRGWFIERITAEEGTYPDDGRYGDYWYVAVGPVWTPPDLRLRVGGVLKQYSAGWVKVGGQLKEIDKMWVKVNGVLREVKEQ